MAFLEFTLKSGLGSRSEPGVFVSFEPEPVEEKKTGAGAGAA